MKRPELQERVQVLEDEVQAMDSMIDSRTRALWAEIVKLRGELGDMRKLVECGRKAGE